MTAPDRPDPTTPDPAGTVFDEHFDLTVLGGPVRVHTAGRRGTPVLLLHGAMLDTAEASGTTSSPLSPPATASM